MAHWSTAPLTPRLQAILSPILASFAHNPDLSKTKNMDSILSHISNEAERGEVEAAMGMKKNSFYDKIIAASQKDREFDAFAEKADDRMQEDQPAIKTEDFDDFASFAVPKVESDFDREMREADEMLAAIKAAKKTK